MQLNILYQDKAKNAVDAAHRQGFSTKYWYKRLVAKCGNYFLNVPYDPSWNNPDYYLFETWEDNVWVNNRQYTFEKNVDGHGCNWVLSPYNKNSIV